MRKKGLDPYRVTDVHPDLRCVHPTKRNVGHAVEPCSAIRLCVSLGDSQNVGSTASTGFSDAIPR